MFVVAWKSKQMKFVSTVRLQQIEQEWTSEYTQPIFYARTRISIFVFVICVEYKFKRETKIRPEFFSCRISPIVGTARVFVY